MEVGTVVIVDLEMALTPFHHNALNWAEVFVLSLAIPTLNKGHCFAFSANQLCCICTHRYTHNVSFHDIEIPHVL